MIDSQPQDQSEDALSTIHLENYEVVWNGNTINYDTSFTFKLNKGENIFVVYTNKKLSCLYQCYYNKTASKIKLSSRPIVELPNGKQYPGQMNKQVFNLESKQAELFMGNISDTVTYDKSTMSTLFVRFDYIIK